MAWSTPLTAVANAALTAAQWNASVRDNLNETAPAKATAAGQLFVSTGVNAIAARTPTTAVVATLESTASTTFVDLTTVGPAVTVTTGTKALVFTTAQLSSNTAGASNNASYAVSGASTVAASVAGGVAFRSAVINQDARISVADLVSGLTPGSNTFTMKYAVGAAPAGTGSFQNRAITVLPL